MANCQARLITDRQPVQAISCAGRHAFMLFAVLVSLLLQSTEHAESRRCPADLINAGKGLTVGEAAIIQSIWKELHGAGASGGDGPLGCPVGLPSFADPTKQTWQGIQQRFQRGWILMGRGPSAGSQIAIVRGLDSWTIWTKGLPSMMLPTVVGVSSTEIRPAVWSHGGSVFTTPGTDKDVSLLLCPSNQSYSQFSISLNGCTQFTPVLDTPNRPFDAAAHLTDALLTTPSADGLEKRIGAMFADWLPCYTRAPRADEVGEAAVARALVMMRRASGCPLVTQSPRDRIKQWLLTLSFPTDMLPGTNSDNESCPRKGELDVTLAQFLRLAFYYRDALKGPVLDHLTDVLNPWGVAARTNPYVTPKGLCYGFALIESENHMLLQETSAYLINGMMGRDTASNSAWLSKFLVQISKRDFYEFNSLPYTRYQLKGLYLLHDHAPDAALKTIAKGMLDWLFMKQAVSGNLDRDHRPYRRIYDNGPLVPRDWWGPAATPVTTATALLVGPLVHAHSDIDLQINDGKDDAGTKVIEDVTGYPKLGTAPAYVTEALVDAAHTGYRFPPALIGWLEKRFVDETANRTTYLQAYSHVTKLKEDRSVFAQSGGGAELVSGNRNWTMIGGGTPSPPGDPGPPPWATGTAAGYTIGGAAVGAVAGAYIGSTVGPIGTAAGAVIGGVVGVIFGNRKPRDIAADKQHDALWDTQAATIRETTLIPTAVGLDRSQTIRFGRSIVTDEGASQIARLCVAEGFMCGFDLRMPTRAFPSADGLNCPLNAPLPAAVVNAFQARVGTGKTITSVLGCLVKDVGFLEDGSWSVWTFENGMLAMALGDTPGKERFAGAWIEDRTAVTRGRLRVSWNIQGDGYDWFRVHAYERSVSATGGEPPGGWIEPLPIAGDAGDRTKGVDGDVKFDIKPDSTDSDDAVPSWDVLVVGCTKKYFLGVLRGHDCTDSKMPRLTVNVGPLPRQSFSCAVPMPPPNFALVRRHEGMVMEVGSCNGGPYGMYVYVWNKACPSRRLSIAQSSSVVCPEGAIDYGFVVAAPSRGLMPEEFRNIVEASMAASRSGGHEYLPGVVASVDVPISPPVLKGPTGNWMPSAAPTKHTVTFRWPVVDGAAIQGDSAAPALFAPALLGAAPIDWPTAMGNVSANEGAVPIAGQLVRNSGNGCFTVSGYPTSIDPDPTGLLVDFRNPSAPVVDDRPSSALGALCP